MATPHKHEPVAPGRRLTLLRCFRSLRSMIPDPTSAHAEPEGTRVPPQGWLGSLRYMGPGLILSAAIVGSGELIATTTLGAKAGFALLWVVLLGCVVKVAVQVEYGRQCILRGATTYQDLRKGADPGEIVLRRAGPAV